MKNKARSMCRGFSNPRGAQIRTITFREPHLSAPACDEGRQVSAQVDQTNRLGGSSWNSYDMLQKMLWHRPHLLFMIFSNLPILNCIKDIESMRELFNPLNPVV